jgi:hypothetical protein
LFRPGLDRNEVWSHSNRLRHACDDTLFLGRCSVYEEGIGLNKSTHKQKQS